MVIKRMCCSGREVHELEKLGAGAECQHGLYMCNRDL